MPVGLDPREFEMIDFERGAAARLLEHVEVARPPHVVASSCQVEISLPRAGTRLPDLIGSASLMARSSIFIATVFAILASSENAFVEADMCQEKHV